MARRFAKGSYQNQNMWKIDAESYYSEFKGIRRLLWSDEKYIVRWVYPLTGGGDKMVGTRVRTEEANQEQLKVRGEERRPFISSLINLRTGGQGFVIMVPIFSDGVYRGDISAPLVAKDFFEEVLKINDYDLVITENGKTIFSSGTPDAVFAKDWTSRVQYNTLGVNWTIHLTPRPSLVRQNTSSLPGVVLLFGFSVSLLLGITLIFFNKSQDSERAAREAYEIKEAGMNSVPLLIISYDAGAIIREMNSTAERVLGYTNKEVAGQASPLLFHDIHEVRNVQLKMENELNVELPLGPEYISAFFKLGYNKASEWTVISKAGKRTTVVMSVSIIFNETGSVAGYLQILEDISLLKEKEQLLKEQERKILISSRMASLGEMAAGIAHEINNPLAIINGHVGGLRKKLQQKGASDDVELIKKVDAIESVVHRIAKIIRGLRSYSREPDAGGKEWISAEQLVDETMDFCTEKFRMEDIQCKVSVEPGVQLYVRHYQISQVLLNLLNNAFDAILGHSVKTIAVDVQKTADGVELSVTDSGPGVP
ncbi:MAG TPA: PAS domain S-box protein, partial [Bdellovibrio sp.]